MKIASILSNGKNVITKWNPFGITFDGSQGWTPVSGKSTSVRVPGSDLNWDNEVGAPFLWTNPTVMLCLGYIFDKVIEPRFSVVYEDSSGVLQPVIKHPLTQLMLCPSTEYMGNALLQGLSLSYKCDGNAYAHKVRDNSGTVIGLEYLPHWSVRPIPSKDTGLIIGYSYRNSINSIPRTEYFLKEDVIHIKDGIDPQYPYLGISRLKSQYRGIVADNEIDTTIAVLLRNRGNMGTIISKEPGSNWDIEPEAWKEFLRKVSEQRAQKALSKARKTTAPSRG